MTNQPGGRNPDSRTNADPLVGAVLDGKLKIVGLIASSDIGGVYSAEHLGLKRPVIVQAIREPSMTPESIERFKQDAAAAAHLTHDSVAHPLEAGVSVEGVAYLVIDPSAGTPLPALVKERVLASDEACNLFQQICKALQAGRSAGQLRGVVKSGDIFIDRPGGKVKARIVDSGLFGSLGAAFGRTSEAPEVEWADDRADIFTIGSALFEALTGKPPFDDAASTSFLGRRLSETLPDPRQFNNTISDSLASIVSKTLEKSPEGGYRKLGDLEVDLNQFLEGKTVHAKTSPVSPKLILGVVLVLIPILICFCLPLWQSSHLREQAYSASDRKDWSEATEAYEALVKAQPDNAENWHDYTNTLLDATKYNHAVLVCREGLKVFPKDEVLWVRLSNAYYYQSKWKEAEDAAKKAIALDPKDCDALINMSYILVEQNKFLDAFSYAKKSIDIDPKFVPGLAAIADLYFKSGQLSEAAAWAKRGLSLDPKNQDLAAILDQTGTPGAAKTGGRPRGVLPKSKGRSHPGK